MEQPSFIPIPFAANGNRSDIPLLKEEEGRASWNIGFPQETSLPQGAGGYAPMRNDFQGVLYALSAHIFFGQSGNVYSWSATLDYNIGAHVLDRANDNSPWVEYVAVARSGPSTSNAQKPSTDVNYTCWKSLVMIMTDYVYPVGSIYMTTAATNPGTIFGGKWSKIENRFLVGASSTYQVTSTNSLSSATHTLTVDEMPAHNHGASAGQAGAGTYNLTINNSVSHTHDISINNGAQSAGAHTHGVTYTATSVSATAASNGAHTHGVTFPKTTVESTSAGAHTHTRGTMEITGRLAAAGLFDAEEGQYEASGALSKYTTSKNKGDADKTGSNTWGLALKASDGWTGATASNGTHAHNITIAKQDMTTVSAGAHTHSVSISIPAKSMTTVSAGAHTHKVVGTSNQGGVHNHTGSVTISNHTHTITTQNRGGGNAFSIIPPYYAVYIWRRYE